MSRLEIYPIGFGIMAGSPSKFRLEVCFIKRNLFIFQQMVSNISLSHGAPHFELKPSRNHRCTLRLHIFITLPLLLSSPSRSGTMIPDISIHYRWSKSKRSSLDHFSAVFKQQGSQVEYGQYTAYQDQDKAFRQQEYPAVHCDKSVRNSVRILISVCIISGMTCPLMSYNSCQETSETLFNDYTPHRS